MNLMQAPLHQIRTRRQEEVFEIRRYFRNSNDNNKKTKTGTISMVQLNELFLMMMMTMCGVSYDQTGLIESACVRTIVCTQ